VNLDLSKKKNISIMCDNQSDIALIKNPTHHSLPNHIDIRHHFIYKKVEHGVIDMKYDSIERMIVDVFTKALGKTRHEVL